MSTYTVQDLIKSAAACGIHVAPCAAAVIVGDPTPRKAESYGVDQTAETVRIVRRSAA